MANGIVDKKGTDVRGLLAVMCVIGAFGLAILSITMAVIRDTKLGEGVTPATFLEIPSWTAGIVGTVIGYYFGSKGAAEVAGSVSEQSSQSVKLDQIHELVNSRMDAAMAKIEGQRNTIEEQRHEHPKKPKEGS